MTTDPLTARAVAVAEWLRRHPDVESGPSVRGTMAFAEVAAAWRRQTGTDDLLAAALVTLPHRLRVRPGADADDLVRRALAGAGGGEAEPGSPEDGGPPGEMSGDEAAAGVSEGHDPDAGEAGWPEAFNDQEARQLLEDLLPPAAPEPLSAGAAPTRPGRRSLDDEVAAVRPLRPGDRARDFSVRHTVRAAAGLGAFGPGSLRGVARRNTARYDVAVVLDVSASMGQEQRPLVAPACAALARALLRDGHRVASVAFCEEAVIARHLSGGPGRLFPAGGYGWAHATNLEEGLEAGRRLLTRESAAGRRRHLILVTDAEATSFNDLPGPFSGGAQAPGFGLRRFSPLAPKPLVVAAQAAALRAATRCARQGVTVSLLYPDDDSDVDFARRLAAAGGGRCRPLRDLSPRPGG